MSLVKNLSSDSAAIIEYLRNNPDFFVAHPELLSELKLPSPKDKNIASFQEYQVIRLREQSVEQQKQLQDLQQHTGMDMALSAAVHVLTLELLAAESPEKLYLSLHRGLRALYSADRVLLIIFNKASGNGSHPRLRFMFTEVFHRNKPLCGSLQEEHMVALFGKDSERIKSTVLLPLEHHHWQGLLVLGSHLQNHFGHGHALDLLVFVKDIVKHRIQVFTRSTHTPDQSAHSTQSG